MGFERPDPLLGSPAELTTTGAVLSVLTGTALRALLRQAEQLLVPPPTEARLVGACRHQGFSPVGAAFVAIPVGVKERLGPVASLFEVVAGSARGGG